MSVRFIDATCPPSSCHAAYNALREKKITINKPLMGHAAPVDIQKKRSSHVPDMLNCNRRNRPNSGPQASSQFGQELASQTLSFNTSAGNSFPVIVLKCDDNWLA